MFVVCSEEQGGLVQFDLSLYIFYKFIQNFYFSPRGDDNPIRVANSLKQLNYFIIGVNYNDVNNLATNLLRNISSAGVFFTASDADYGFLSTELLDAFYYGKMFYRLYYKILHLVNCFCPSYTQQLFVITNQTTGSGKYYADCIFGSSSGTYWIFAELACAKKNGILVTFTSKAKENFVLS